MLKDLLNKTGLRITQVVGTMYMFLLFTLLALVALPQAIASHSLVVLVNWLSSNFLQLVLLPILLVGQGLQNEKASEQSNQQWKMIKKIERMDEKIERLLKDKGK